MIEAVASLFLSRLVDVVSSLFSRWCHFYLGLRLRGGGGRRGRRRGGHRGGRRVGLGSRQCDHDVEAGVVPVDNDVEAGLAMEEESA